MDEPVVSIFINPSINTSTLSTVVLFSPSMVKKWSWENGPPSAVERDTPDPDPARNSILPPPVIEEPSNFLYSLANTVPSTVISDAVIPVWNSADDPDWMNKLLLYWCIPAIN